MKICFITTFSTTRTATTEEEGKMCFFGFFGDKDFEDELDEDEFDDIMDDD